MKSLGKLKRFAFQQKSDGKERRDFPLPSKLDELALASQEMQDMRNCYDGLLSAAAATANSAYEFSESLRDLGACLLEKTTLYNDEESGKALLILGKVQLELQKLLDHYRSDICLTITTPSESLLNELKTVEEMKRQCDEKRSVYEFMMAQEGEKGRSKSGKGESFTLEQLQAAHNDYEEEATLCVFRLKSLKEGQSRSLLTQAARHHTAQMNFFRKGLRSLESVDPHVKLIAEKHHIDHQLCGRDEGDEEGDGENGYGSNGDGEISFKYRQQKPGVEVMPTSRNSMELDQEDLSFPKPSAAGKTEALHRKPARGDKLQDDSPAPESEHRSSSHSAPIFPEKKFDPAERIRQMRPSRSQKFHSYVLPTPVDTKSSTSSRTSSSTSRTNPSMWHPSQSESSKMHNREPKDENFSAPILKGDLASLNRNSYDGCTYLPLPLADGHSFAHDTHDASDPKKIKRQASFSGPLISKPQSTKASVVAGEPIGSSDLTKLISGSVSQASTSQPVSSSKQSSNISSSASPPKISELHELPRPPSSAAVKSTRSSSSVGHSAPLTSRASEFPVTNKTPAGGLAAPLLAPPLTAPRSFSIPSSSPRAMSLQVASIPESPQPIEKAGETTSPPLSPLSLTASEVRTQPGDV